MVIPNVLAQGKSYEHGFTKKETLRKVTCKVEFRSIFCAPSQKFKVLAVPNVFDHGKSYEHDFMKKYDGHKLCAKSSFNRFFVYCLGNSKFKPFPTYLPLEVICA
ncbi:hypothetical protein BHE74_00054320 [Ensete ventricosum]|nr:hypothetical protein BHE74_00054320 [Ensete ventricosum]RZS05958.1 hypothetical protein BHM03_00036546 [Ensete ventricosum]